jgi:hypothetical protein
VVVAAVSAFGVETLMVRARFQSQLGVSQEQFVDGRQSRNEGCPSSLAAERVVMMYIALVQDRSRSVWMRMQMQMQM